MRTNKDGLPLVDMDTRQWFYNNHELGKDVTYNQFYQRLYYSLYIKKDVKLIEEVMRKQEELDKHKRGKLEKIKQIYGKLRVAENTYDPFAAT